ncbi:TetR/AcrR family transcriptional regulator [Aeromicrobium sp. CF4.19]|uniref:TetR/AcrR family transcriptional regulator n=1 Tax=Aeromicrobium sp. CF4.19 TaxID=3373082 RepID=UPI003EE4CDCC
MSERRSEIAQRAVELFADRGFHGVSVADVGAASGISGPAIYKHFRSKEAVLAQALVDISTELLETGRARIDGAADDDARLEALVEWHIDFAVAHPAYIVVQEREWSTLEAADRSRVRELQLAYVDVWVDVVRRLRDDLSRAEARAAVQATFGLLNSTPHSARIGEPSLRALLARMAHAALLG